jgi:hypothetical protein
MMQQPSDHNYCTSETDMVILNLKWVKTFSILGPFSVDFRGVWVTRLVISAEASVTCDIDQISSSAGTCVTLSHPNPDLAM